MKPKNLIPLAVVLVVLAALVALRQAGQETASLTEQVHLESLVPDGLEQADIARVEIYAGAVSDEPVVLERESPEAWKVTSHFDAPVNRDKMGKFLTTLTGIQGEFRAEAAGEDLAAYELGDDDAFHVKGFSEGVDEPLFHILSGKAPGFGNAFARTADGENVYVINVNLRREAGLYSTELSDPPKASAWLDKKVLDLKQDKIKGVALQYPDKELAFEYKKFERPAKENAEEGEAKEGDGEDNAPKGVVEYEWVVSKGGTGEELNVTALTNLTRRAAGLNATDIVDPAKTAEWKLDAPEYVCRLQIEGREDDVVIEAGRPEGGRDAYVRLAGAEKPLIYKISGYDFEQIFQAGGQFFELPGILLDKDEVGRIEYIKNGHTVVLAKTDGNWTIAEPQTDLDVVPGRLDRIVRAVLSWKASDYADSADGTGLDDPSAAVTITGVDGTHTIGVGNNSASGKGYYARLDASDRALVMGEREEADIFAAPRDLFERAVLDVDEDDITRIEITQGDSTIRLEQGDAGWKVIAGEDVFEADEAAVNDLRAVLSTLEADDFALGDARVPGDAKGSILFATKDGVEQRINVEIGQDGLFPVTLPGKTAAYLVGKASIARLFPPIDTLKKPEEAGDETAAEEEVPAAEN